MGDVIKTENKKIDQKDLIIITSRNEIIYALKSDNPKKYFYDSVIRGDTNYKLVSSKMQLLSKGYVSFYNHLTKDL